MRGNPEYENVDKTTATRQASTSTAISYQQQQYTTGVTAVMKALH